MLYICERYNYNLINYDAGPFSFNLSLFVSYDIKLEDDYQNDIFLYISYSKEWEILENELIKVLNILFDITSIKDLNPIIIDDNKILTLELDNLLLCKYLSYRIKFV